MDHNKHKLIEKYVLSFPMKKKPENDKWCGVYVYGDDKDFSAENHVAAIHSFKVFSEFDYPLYLFINQFRYGDLDLILEKYSNIKVIPILTLRNSFEYNSWFVNSLWHLLPNHDYCLTYQSDGFLLKPGYEEFVESNDFDYIGGSWKNEVKLKTKFDFPGQRVGNGGVSARKPRKMLEILNFINSNGGQEKLIEGQYNDNKLTINHYNCPEDAVFSTIGFGAGILKPVAIEQANNFSHEPIEFKLAISNSESKPYAYHRCDF